MPGIPPVPDDELSPAFAAMAKRAAQRGSPDGLLKVLAHQPELVGAFFSFYLPQLQQGRVPGALKELARLKVASHNGCFT